MAADLLGDLLQMAQDQGLMKKTKRSETTMGKKREDYVYVPITDRFKSVELVMINHQTVCLCCNHIFETPNKPLVKRVNPRGDVHYKDTIDRSEYSSLPRVVETKQYTVESCMNCFHDGDWLKKALPPTSDPESLITELLREVEDNAD